MSSSLIQNKRCRNIKHPVFFYSWGAASFLESILGMWFKTHARAGACRTAVELLPSMGLIPKTSKRNNRIRSSLINMTTRTLYLGTKVSWKKLWLSGGECMEPFLIWIVTMWKTLWLLKFRLCVSTHFFTKAPEFMCHQDWVIFLLIGLTFILLLLMLSGVKRKRWVKDGNVQRVVACIALEGTARQTCYRWAVFSAPLLLLFILRQVSLPCRLVLDSWCSSGRPWT